MPWKRDCQTPRNAHYVTMRQRVDRGSLGITLGRLSPLGARMHRAAAASRRPKPAARDGVGCALAAGRFLRLNWIACPKASSPPAPPRKRARCGRTTREPGSGDAVRDERARPTPLTLPASGTVTVPAPHRGGACPARPLDDVTLARRAASSRIFAARPMRPHRRGRCAAGHRSLPT